MKGNHWLGGGWNVGFYFRFWKGRGAFYIEQEQTVQKVLFI